jgi:hypothetical protein
MTLLWQLLHSSDPDLDVLFFGRSGQEALFSGRSEGNDGRSEVKYHIGNLLGSGSQGLVYAADTDRVITNEDQATVVADKYEFIVKASVAGDFRYIKREILALRTLWDDDTENLKGCKYIPEIKAIGCVEYTIRQTSSRVPAFVMFPSGVPALQFFSSNPPNYKPKLLLELWSNVSEALAFAHEKKVYMFLPETSFIVTKVVASF